MEASRSETVLEESLDERALVERARTDPEAFAALYRLYLARIHAFCYRRTGSQEVAEDVTAATFERALRYLPSYQWRDRGFGPWLYRIAANELANHYRAEYRRRSERAQEALQVLSPGTSHTEEGFERVEDLADEPNLTLRAAMGAINPRYQEALSLRFLAGLSLDDAAAAMGCSKTVMSVTVHRALGALRRQLRALAAQEEAS